MATIQKSARKGSIASNEPITAQAENVAESNDVERQSGAENLAERKHVAKDWPEVEARLAEIESPQNGIVRLHVPKPAQALWVGVYGSATIEVGDWYAITSDGVKHAL